MSHSPPLFTSRFNIPYSPTSPLHTLDLHFPSPSPSSANPTLNASPSSSPKFLLIFIHGGALRDPDTTSRSILPSLPALFSLPGFPLLAVASVNYRLAPYPNHPTAPSHPSDPSRNAVWPAPLEDVVQAIQWLASGEGRQLWKIEGEKSEGEEGIILAGHSVGATLCLHAAPRLLSLPAQSAGRVRAVVGVAGVYDFSALRDEHLHAKAVYEAINTGSFGPEKHENEGEWRGGWGRGKVDGREWRAEGVEVVVLGHGRADEMVDMGQAERLVRELEEGGTQHGEEKSPVVRMVECKGSHGEMVNVGEEVGRCVGIAVEVMLDGSTRGPAAAKGGV